MAITVPHLGLNLCSRAHDYLTVLVEGFLDIITMLAILVFPHMLEKKIFEMLAFLYICPPPPPWHPEGCGAIKFSILISLSIEMPQTKNGNNQP